jgi:hypothetical protein
MPARVISGNFPQFSSPLNIAGEVAHPTVLVRFTDVGL